MENDRFQKCFRHIFWFTGIVVMYDVQNMELFNLCKVTLDEAVHIEEITRKQSKSDHWIKQRQNRITSSKFGDIIKRKAPVNESLINRIWPRTSVTTASMKMGLDNEEKAVEKYLMDNPTYKAFTCGVCINPGIPFLASTPDRLIYDTETEQCHLLEIKTLVKGGLTLKQTVRECIQDKSAPFLEVTRENEIRLKENHGHYMQIQA
ncbi:unnamed protein product [Phaedon cochleariae]|uniref:YqaJ viral recombinase domain-containing protein n=1 Tax=Phaedon cochleariae TaxID=80249 RepID=A0A9P0DLB9_PHACE|nr:unnamed protein product [Phaedon cochleariae]